MKKLRFEVLLLGAVLSSGAIGNDLCSSVTSTSAIAGHSCNGLPGAPFTVNIQFTVSKKVQQYICSTSTVAASQVVTDAGTGICGSPLLAINDWPPFTDYTVALIGSGSNWNAYQQKWTGIVHDISMNYAVVAGNWSNHYTFPVTYQAQACQACTLCGSVCMECAKCSCQGEHPTCQQNAGGWWPNCTNGCTPIVMDPFEEGFHLTNLRGGVKFRVNPGGPLQQMSWTNEAWRNGWLTLDRNGNGVIDDFTELFGNLTPQPRTNQDPNGFLALAVFDNAANGGNGNGVIDPGDAVYTHLRLWIDANHNGISEPNELHTLQEMGVFKISLKYHNSWFIDQYGNQFRYRGSVWDDGGHGRESCYDVLLQIDPLIEGGGN